MQYRIPDDVLHRVVQTDTVILNAATNAYVSLNTSAGRIWELFGAGHTADEVQAVMLPTTAGWLPRGQRTRAHITSSKS